MAADSHRNNWNWAEFDSVKHSLWHGIPPRSTRYRFGVDSTSPCSLRINYTGSLLIPYCIISMLYIFIYTCVYNQRVGEPVKKERCSTWHE